MQAQLDPWKPGRFPAHGEISVHWTGPLLQILCRGPINTEAVDGGMRLLAQVGRSQWPADGKVIEVTQWVESMLMSPEAVRTWELWIQRFHDHGYSPRHTVVIAPMDVEGRSFVLPKLLKIWSTARPVTVFTDRAEALQFAQTLSDELAAKPSDAAGGSGFGPWG